MGYEFKLRLTKADIERIKNQPRRHRGPSKPKTPRVPIAPLRTIIGHIEIEAGIYEGPEHELNGTMLYFTHELLECFHHQAQKEDIYGPTNANRRRCDQCFKEQQGFGRRATQI